MFVFILYYYYYYIMHARRQFSFYGFGHVEGPAQWATTPSVYGPGICAAIIYEAANCFTAVAIVSANSAVAPPALLMAVSRVSNIILLYYAEANADRES